VKPVLFVTNHAPPFRVGAFGRLHEAEDVDFVLIGGDVRHGGGAGEPAIGRYVSQRDVYGLAASGRYRAVVAGLSGSRSWCGRRCGPTPGRRFTL
jgi:hypothetical protein